MLFLIAGRGDSTEDDGADATPELPDAAIEVYEDYTQTRLDAAGAAMLAYVTDDFTWLSYGTDLMDAEFFADYVTEHHSGFEVKEIGDRMVVGGGDEYISAVREQVAIPLLAEGISLVKMVQVDGEWLVEAHRFLGEGEGSG